MNLTPFDIGPDIASSPEVMEIAEKMKKNRFLIVGLIVAFRGWCYRHAHGCETGLSRKSLNTLLSTRGIAEAMISVGMLIENEDKKLVINVSEPTQGSCEPASVTEMEIKRRPMTQAERAQKTRDKKKALRDAASQDRHEDRHEERDDASRKNVTRHVTPPPYIYTNTIESSATVVERGRDAFSESTAGTTRARQIKKLTYSDFLLKIGGAHPTSSSLLLLPKDAEAASRTAYETWDLGDDEAELLTAFYKADMSTVPKGTKFWRPRSLKQYYDQLGDVLSHAQDWAKWKGWKPKAKAQKIAQKQAEKPPEPEDQSPEDHEEMMAFWNAQKENLRIPSINAIKPISPPTEECPPTTTTPEPSITT